MNGIDKEVLKRRFFALTVSKAINYILGRKVRDPQMDITVDNIDYATIQTDTPEKGLLVWNSWDGELYRVTAVNPDSVTFEVLYGINMETTTESHGWFDIDGERLHAVKEA